MKKLLLLYWLIPIYLLFLSSYELLTYIGIQSTNKDGVSLISRVDYLKIKNMQAQSNGVIDISFTDDKGVHHTKKMTLPVQLAAQLQELAMIPIRYKESSFMPIVFMPTYEFHYKMVLMNMAITFSSFLAVLWGGFRINRFIFNQSSTELLNNQVQRAWEQAKPIESDLV
jgi:hypothetical protein